MKSPLRSLALVTLAFVFASASAFAQFAPKGVWILTIAVNAPNAVVWVDNVQVPRETRPGCPAVPTTSRCTLMDTRTSSVRWW